MAFDILIRGGTVVDGSGRARFQADVGVTNGRIEAIGRLDRAEAARVIDASGLAVAPGFIDIHTHSDVTLLDDPGGESKAHQGVTTEVTGNCSYSPFPSGNAAPGDLQEIMGFTMASETEWDWTTMDEWASRVDENGVGINVAAQLGQSALRIAVGATDDRAATPDEVRAMKRLAEESIEQGAFSITTGLTITPSCYAPTEEIVELCKSVARYDGAFYATHARSGPGLHLKMIEEAAEIGRLADIPVQFSHIGITESYLYGKGHELIAVFERARSEGVDIVFDMYPYTAAGIDLHQVVPVWVREGGVRRDDGPAGGPVDQGQGAPRDDRRSGRQGAAQLGLHRHQLGANGKERRHRGPVDPADLGRHGGRPGRDRSQADARGGRRGVRSHPQPGGGRRALLPLAADGDDRL